MVKYKWFSLIANKIIVVMSYYSSLIAAIKSMWLKYDKSRKISFETKTPVHF